MLDYKMVNDKNEIEDVITIKELPNFLNSIMHNDFSKKPTHVRVSFDNEALSDWKYPYEPIIDEYDNEWRIEFNGIETLIITVYDSVGQKKWKYSMQGFNYTSTHSDFCLEVDLN